MTSVLELDDGEVETLTKLAKPLLNEETIFKRSLRMIDKTKLTLILWVDIIGHFVAIGNKSEGSWEGVLTPCFFFFSTIFTFPLIKFSPSDNRFWIRFLMIIGLYDLKRYCVRERQEMDLRNHVRPYVDRRRAINSETLQVLFWMEGNRVTDDTANFRREVMGTLPLLITKVYFALTMSTCSYLAVIRLVVILIGFIEPIKACCAQEKSLMDYVKLANLYDHAVIEREFFNTAMGSVWTSVFAHFSTGISILYRVYGTVFYTVLNPIVGLIQILFAWFLSSLQHVTLRPMYENPPIGAETVGYEVVETVAKLFTIRYSRLYVTTIGVQLQLWVLWGFLLILEQSISLYFIHFAFINGIIDNPWSMTTDNSDNVTCPGLIPKTIDWFFEQICPDYSFLQPDATMTTMMTNPPLIFTILLLLNIVVNLTQLVYLGLKKLNETKFPTITSAHVWTAALFGQLFEWSPEGLTHWQILWVKKLMLMTLLSPAEFAQYLPPWSRCCGRTPKVNWKVLAIQKVGNIVAPERHQIARMFNDQSLASQLRDFVKYIYDIPNSEAYLLRKLSIVMCNNFDKLMATMNSRRVSITCKILDVNPDIGSLPMRK